MKCLLFFRFSFSLRWFCLVTESCPTLRDPMDCSPPGSSVHGILQARRLEWVVVSFTRDLPDPGIEPRSPALADRFFTIWATWEVLSFVLSHFRSLFICTFFFPPLQASVSQRETMDWPYQSQLTGGGLRFLCSTPDLKNESPAQEFAFIKEAQAPLMHMKP